MLLAASSGLTGCSGLAQPTKAEARGQLSISPTSANFGAVGIGTKQSQSVVLINQGNAPVTISSVKPTGTGFSVDGITVPMTLSPGANASLKLSFTPSSTQSVTGSVVVLSDAANSPVSIALSGSGSSTTLTLTPSTSQLTFNSVLVGASNSSTVTLTNQGNAPVTISGVSGTGAGFVASGIPAGTVLQPGQSAALQVVFTPTAVGAASGQLTVNSNASPVVILLSGTAVQQSAHSVDLTWNSVADVAGYNVYRQSPGATDFVKINTATVATTQFADNNVAAGETYVYVVTSVGTDGGESADSASVTIQIPTS